MRQRMSELRRRPDLVWVYTGHNEFLYNEIEFRKSRQEAIQAPVERIAGRSRLYVWARQRLEQVGSLRKMEIETQLNQSSFRLCTPEQYEHRVRRFREHLSEICRFTQRHEIPTVLTIPACNQVGFAPNQSGFSILVSGEERAAFLKHLQTARQLLAVGELASAESQCREALAIDDTFADAHFTLARILHAGQKIEESRRHYAVAVDYDTFPLRAAKRFREVVRQVAAETDAILIDAEQVIRGVSATGELDDSVFFDLVHPRAVVYDALADATRDALHTHKVLASAKAGTGGGSPQKIEAILLEGGFSNTDWIRVLDELISYLSWVSLFQRDHTECMQRIQYYKSARARVGKPDFDAFTEIEQSDRLIGDSFDRDAGAR